MKIPESLAFLFNKETLFIVSGEKEARLYLISGDQLSELSHPIGPEIKYTDRESFYTSSTKGVMLGAGAIKNNVEEKERREFDSIFEEALSSALKSHSVERILLTVPRYVAEIRRQSIKEKTKIDPVEIYGNFTRETPLEVLRKFEKTNLS